MNSLWPLHDLIVLNVWYSIARDNLLSFITYIHTPREPYPSLKPFTHLFVPFLLFFIISSAFTSGVAHRTIPTPTPTNHRTARWPCFDFRRSLKSRSLAESDLVSKPKRLSQSCTYILFSRLVISVFDSFHYTNLHFALYDMHTRTPP